MNKFHILIFVAIIGIFGLIIYETQKETAGKSGLKTNQAPSLPPTSDTLGLSNQSSFNDQDKTQQKNPDKEQQAKQQTAQQQQAEIQGPINASVSATLKTTKGNIGVVLFGKEAQKTVANFINKSKNNFYNGLTFHRVEDWVVQGGDPTGKGTGGGMIQTELNSQPFTVGSLGMAASSQMQVGQGARISNDSQFFITTKDADWLNGQYTNFGIVKSGMDVVNRIKIGDKILGITID